jgi:HAMP domain-containing protein
MHLFSSIKLKLRFSFLLIIMIAALGSGYSFYLIQKSQAFLQYKERANGILMHLKEARLEEKNFVLYGRKESGFLSEGNSPNIENHRLSIYWIEHQVDTLLNQAGLKDAVLYAQLIELRAAVTDYNHVFQNLAALYMERGFKDHGLEGSMRENVHDLQKCVSAEEQVYAFSLRRHEKDFMLRKDLRYFETLKNTAEEFQDYVAQSTARHMTYDYKKTTINVIGKYVEKFSKIVDIETKIGLSANEGVSGELNNAASALEPISSGFFRYIENKSTSLQTKAVVVLFGSMLTTLIVGLLISLSLDHAVSRPIMLLNQVIQDKINGKSASVILDKISNKDEIGLLAANFKLMMQNQDAHLNEISEKNQSLELSNEENRKRKWIAEGVSSFVDVMKNTQAGIPEISYKIIAGVVQQTGANQGGIFYIDDLENPEKMILAASYAYNRRKYLNKEVFCGEGLIGAVWEEKQMMTMSGLPQGYISVTSGLGEALPDNLIIVPLIHEEIVYGVMEIASFQVLEQHQIDLIQKNCERLASTFLTFKIQEKTSTLLQTSQMQAEELKAQEEEMTKP